MADHRADADGDLDLQVLGQGILDALGDAVDLLPVAPLGEGFDDGNVGLVDGDDEIIGLSEKRFCTTSTAAMSADSTWRTRKTAR